MKLNPKKAGRFGNISTEVLKESSDASNLALKPFEFGNVTKRKVFAIFEVS